MTMRLATVEAAAVAHAFALRHMYATMGAGQYAFRLIEPVLPPRFPRGIAHALQGTTHPPDTTQNQQEDQQIAHDGQE
ncbi:hypothetical protein J5J83_18540 [Azoarcus sp. L1K30]|nr:hypothetical protein [Azoarcus sp. L1K30]